MLTSILLLFIHSDVIARFIFVAYQLLRVGSCPIAVLKVSYKLELDWVMSNIRFLNLLTISFFDLSRKLVQTGTFS